MDYVLLSKTLTIDEFSMTIQCHIDILDDLECADNDVPQFFFILLTLESGNCVIPNEKILVTIIDDGTTID